MKRPNEICRSCIYWDNDRDDRRTGYCREGTPHPDGSWPLTVDKEWCGRHPEIARAVYRYVTDAD